MNKIARLSAFVLVLVMVLSGCKKQKEEDASSAAASNSSGVSVSDVQNSDSFTSDSVSSAQSGGLNSTAASNGGSSSLTSSTLPINKDWSSDQFAVKDLGDIQLNSYPVDTVYDWAHSIIKMGNVYKMWWVRQSPYDTVWYAESTDLKNWTKEEKIIEIEKDSEWVKMHIGNPDVIYVNGKYYMYFEAPATVDASTKVECDNNVFLATSTDGKKFTMYPSNSNPQPVVKQPASSMRQGKYGVGQPSAFYKDGEFVLYYTDVVDSAGVKVARSKDGIHFGDYKDHPQVFTRPTVGVKYNALTKKYMMAYSLTPYDFDKTKARNMQIYIMESSDGIKWEYPTKEQAWKNPYIVSSSEAMTRNYPDFVTNAQGLVDNYTMYVVYTQGDLAGAGEDWRATASTWDGHIAAVNPKEFGKRTIDLPNGKQATAANLKAYSDKNVTWGKLSATAKFGTPTIDGQMDSIWKNTQELSVNRLVSNWGSLPTKVTGKARVMWDNDNIYFYIEVKDPVVSYKYDISFLEEMWHRDSVDFFIDVPNDDTKTDQVYTPLQYMFSVCANKDSVVKNYRENDFSEEFSKKATVKTVSGGYVIEARLSWYSMVKSQIKAGKKIGFDLLINDDPGVGDRQSQISWNDYTGNAFRYRDRFGMLTLVK